MAERYFAALEAPKGKHLIWFENFGHWPQLEESARYQRAMREIADVIGPQRQ